MSHNSSKRIPISIGFLHSRAESDGNTDESPMSLNNSMNIRILNNPHLVGRHLIWMWNCYGGKCTTLLRMTNLSPQFLVSTPGRIKCNGLIYCQHLWKICSKSPKSVGFFKENMSTPFGKPTITRVRERMVLENSDS